MTVCREVVDRENVQITAETCANGRGTTSAPVTSSEDGVGRVDDLLRMRVCTTNDASSVFVFSASLVDDAGNPEWVQIGDAVSLTLPARAGESMACRFYLWANGKTLPPRSRSCEQKDEQRSERYD